MPSSRNSRTIKLSTISFKIFNEIKNPKEINQDSVVYIIMYFYYRDKMKKCYINPQKF